MRCMGRSQGFVRSASGLLLTALIVAAAAAGCKEKALQRGSRASDAGEVAGGLTPQQAGLVLARVGDRDITLGEYAATLERMDQFDRLRYQTPERRKELLDQMIAVELLANEARRRGLDKEPEVAEALRQVLRDAIVRKVRLKGRAPMDIPEPEVRAWFDTHKQDFEEPERRRVGHLVLKDKAKAEKVLAEARKATPAQWGELVLEHSLESPGKPYKGSLELLGDLGLVGPSSDPRGGNPKVPAEVRKAAFEIGKLGDVLDHLVQTEDGNWHIVKLMGKTDPHTRSFAEAERTIRITMAQKEMGDADKALEEELRKKIPVQVDEAALGRVKVPEDLGGPDAGAPAHGHDHED
jgi:peptidyl-prolyl cis-trans isomerase C